MSTRLATVGISATAKHELGLFCANNGVSMSGVVTELVLGYVRPRCKIAAGLATLQLYEDGEGPFEFVLSDRRIAQLRRAGLIKPCDFEGCESGCGNWLAKARHEKKLLTTLRKEFGR